MNEKEVSKELIEWLSAILDNHLVEGTRVVLDWQVVRVLLHTFLAADGAAEQVRKQSQSPTIEIGDTVRIMSSRGFAAELGTVEAISYLVKMPDGPKISIGSEHVFLAAKGNTL